MPHPIVYSRRSDKFMYVNATSYCDMDILRKVMSKHEQVRWCWEGLDINLMPYYIQESPLDDTLIFESRFESGNLDIAVKFSQWSYLLLMQNDTNTNGNNQWFYFKVSNTRKGSTVHFEIANYTKSHSLFSDGMRISVHSEKYQHSYGEKWTKECENIEYVKNNYSKTEGKKLYSLKFTYTFNYDNDVVWFAYSVPYTYTDLLNDLTLIEEDSNRKQFVKKLVLCKTLAGNPCYKLHITSTQPQKSNKLSTPKKKTIILSARVHPGETVSSWMIRGTLMFLTGNSPAAAALREAFIFIVIPMLNPDGVIQGNYRTSLIGCDLNRKYSVATKAYS